MKNNLKNKSYDLFLKSRPQNIILAVTSGILLAGIASLCSLSLFLGLVGMLILFLPLLFSCYSSFYAFSKLKDKPLTFFGQMRLFSLYFLPHFRGTFSFWKSILFGLIIYASFSLIFIPISFPIINSIYPTMLSEFYNRFKELIAKSSDVSVLTNLINEYAYVLNPFLSIWFVPPFCLAIIGFLYSISIHSLSFYFRINKLAIPDSICNKVCTLTLKHNLKNILKDYFSLNWPYLALLFFGLLGGALLGLLNSYIYDRLLLFAILMGIFLSSLYFPIYFPNLELIYLKYINEYNKELILFTQDKAFNNVSNELDKIKNVFNNLSDDGIKKDDEKKE